MSYSILLSLGSIDLKMIRSGKPYHFPLSLNEDLYLLKVHDDRSCTTAGQILEGRCFKTYVKKTSVWKKGVVRYLFWTC